MLLSIIWALWTVCPPPALAQPALSITELQLSSRPVHVGVVRWDSREAVMALSVSREASRTGSPRLPTRRLSLIRRTTEEPKEIAGWDVPEATRWVEPVPFRGGSAWLALMGSEWMLGVPAASGLDWLPLCSCPSIFSIGRSSLDRDTALASDLDADGQAEVLLPGADGITVYGLRDRPPRLEPLWRDAWTLRERFREESGRLQATFGFPKYLLRDVDADGIRDLIVQTGDRLETTLHPPPSGWPRMPGDGSAPYYAFDAVAQQRLERLHLPEALMLGLRQFGQRGFDSFEAAREGLLAELPEVEAFIVEILQAAEQPYPVLFSQPALQERPTMPREDEDMPAADEDIDVLAVEDMDGDAIPDVLEIVSIEKGDPFNQQNRVSWYRGRLAPPGQDRSPGSLTFGAPEQVYFTEGLAFAALIQPESGGPGSFFLATMEVGFMDLVRAILARSVTFNTFLYPWQNAELPAQAAAAGDVTFSVEFSEKGSRPYLVLADLDGDGVREMFFNEEPGRLAGYVLRSGKDELAASPFAEARVPLPRKSKHVLRAQLGESRRETLVLYYPGPRYSAAERRTLRFLDWQVPPATSAPTRDAQQGGR